MKKYYAEALGTFALVFYGTGAIIINQAPGGAITHMGIAFTFGPVCGASMNPIRSLSPAVVSGHPEHLWIYLSAPMLPAVLAIGSWKIIKSE